MAIMKSATILPGTRRASRVHHLASFSNNPNPDQVRTAAEIDAIVAAGADAAQKVASGAEYALPGGQQETLMFVAPVPKYGVTQTPKEDSKSRYYLYHMVALRVGTAVVKTEDTIKVVYMTATQAVPFLKDYVIGTLPWASLPSATKARINAFLHQVVA